MISSIIFIVFFFILILFYPSFSLVLSLSACLLKRRAEKRNINIRDKKSGEIIDKKTDKLKELVFIVSVFFIFFFAAPLAAFYLIGIGAIKLISW